jgi:hypothetical protein
MNTKPAIRFGVTALLCAITSLHSGAAIAAPEIPTSCIDQSGAGTNIPGGWAFVLNFSTLDQGCLVTLNPDGSRAFKLVPCQVQGQVEPLRSGGVLFGAGGHMLCDIDVRSTEAAEQLRHSATDTKYWISARASFPEKGTPHIFEYGHPAKGIGFSSMSADVLADGWVTLNNTFGPNHMGMKAAVGHNNEVSIFAAVNRFETVGHQSMSFASSRSITGESHIDATSQIEPFDLPSTSVLVIGSPDNSTPFVLTELVIDPPGRCCSGG